MEIYELTHVVEGKVRANIPEVLRLFDKDDADLRCDDAWDVLDHLGPDDDEHAAALADCLAARNQPLEKRMWSYDALKLIRGAKGETFINARAAALRVGPTWLRLWIVCQRLGEMLNFSRPGSLVTASDLAKLSMILAGIPLVASAVWAAFPGERALPGPQGFFLILSVASFSGKLLGPIAVCLGLMSVARRITGHGLLSILMGLTSAIVSWQL